MKKSKEEIKKWNEYRLSVTEQKMKSDDDFEKYITFISSGALGLSLTFIDKISPLKQSVCLWIIVIGWFSLAITLFFNLLSHFLSSKYSEKIVQEIDDEIEYDILISNINKRNRVISILNLISIILLGVGIILILIFTTINAYKND